MEVIRMENAVKTITKRGVAGRKLVDIPAVSVTNLLLAPGETVPEHVTAVDVLFYVVHGAGTVQIGDEAEGVRETDLVVSPKDIPHALRADLGEAFQVLVLKMPNPHR